MTQKANLWHVPGEHRGTVAAALLRAGWELSLDGPAAAGDCLQVLWLDKQSQSLLARQDANLPTVVIVASDEVHLGGEDWAAPCPWALVPWPIGEGWLCIAADQARRLASVMAPRDRSKPGEGELREAHRRASAMSDPKSVFIASISHELRTPMNAVIGYSGLLMELGLEGQAEAYVHSVYTSANHLLALINDVLDLSRIEAGELRLEQTPFDVRECVESAIEMLSESADDKGLTLALNFAGEAGRVVGDATRLRQIVLNLVSNACKFTDSGGVAVNLYLRPIGRRVDIRIEVIDSGIGMDASTLSRLFHPFRQGDDSMSRRFGGSGLGLSICKRLLDLQSGKISVSSKPGAGSCFVVELPLPACGSSVTAAPAMPLQLPTRDAAAVSRGLGELRILVVEDNPINQWLLVLQIEALGGCAQSAANGNEALTLLAREHFDVIFMDIEMPEMDGIETTLRLRRLCNPDRPPPYIVAATAHVLGDSRRRFIDAGMDDFLGKPVLVDRLREVLMRAAGARSLQHRQPALVHR